MEVGDLVSLLSSIAAVAGSGWLGILSSGVVIILFVVAFIYLKNYQAEVAFKESKEKELADQVNNRSENDTVEKEWDKALEAAKEQKTDSKEKKKRTWLS